MVSLEARTARPVKTPSNLRNVAFLCFGEEYGMQNRYDYILFNTICLMGYLGMWIRHWRRTQTPSVCIPDTTSITCDKTSDTYGQSDPIARTVSNLHIRRLITMPPGQQDGMADHCQKMWPRRTPIRFLEFYPTILSILSRQSLIPGSATL
mmetsp:Transcript_11538/g.24673  ORF Transcript_11538/g.24673 Transcript_11538/m.24673 type:complete len:151 (-) Transcript_11538:139-591(-)